MKKINLLLISLFFINSCASNKMTLFGKNFSEKEQQEISSLLDEFESTDNYGSDFKKGFRVIKITKQDFTNSFMGLCYYHENAKYDKSKREVVINASQWNNSSYDGKRKLVFYGLSNCLYDENVSEYKVYRYY